MALSGRSFFDTSVLLAGLIDFGRDEEPAQRLLDAVAAGDLPAPSTAWHCCLEVYSVATRLPEEFRVPPAEAARLVTEEILGRFEVHSLPPERRPGLVAAAAEERIAGGRTYDFHIAEVARAAGANIVVTGNRRHFVALLRHGVRVLTAGELVNELGLAS